MSTHLLLTPAMLVTVAEIKKRIGILTVKDKQTGGNPHARDYGLQYTPVINRNVSSGVPTLDGNIQHERVIQMWFPDSPVFPGGVPVGVVRVYQRKQLRDFGGDDDYRMIRAEEDICFDEQKQVKALAYGKTWMTKEERDLDEQQKTAMRAKRVYADLDPSTALANALIAALKATGIQLPAPKAPPAPAEEPDPVVSVVTGDAALEAEAELGVPGAQEKIDLRTKEGRALKERLALAGAPPK